ncbi:CU044_5270 family protein [Micromonospora sp. NPDC094482]|uniref:CU044_5270 family protein n=1 Tax=unclassified Micromonospora TaxID=2617518 RepID=UPI003333849A
MFGEERTRTLLGPADPARYSTIAPPRLSAHDLIVRAEAVPDPVDHRRRARPTRRLVLTAGTLAAAVGAAAVAQTFGPSSPDTSEVASPPGADPGVVLVPVAYGSGTRDAGSQLRALAGRLADAEYDNRTGRYMYHRTRAWGDAVMRSPDDRYHASFASETKLWRAADGTGKQATTLLGVQYPDRESQAYWQREWQGSQPKAAASPGATARPGDSYPLPPDGRPPLPSNRAGLSEMLKVRHGASALSKEVGTVYAQYVLPRETRAEVLRILADVPGFVWRGEVTDRAGRKGVAVTFDDREHDGQSLLIFDPNTGALLAHEWLTLSPVRISAYQVILDTAWSDQLG